MDDVGGRLCGGSGGRLLEKKGKKIRKWKECPLREEGAACGSGCGGIGDIAKRGSAGIVKAW